MIITRETKERFVKMLDARQIIVVRASIINRKYPHYKVIGANDFGRWDFTPCIADVTGCNNIPVACGEIAITGTIDTVSFIAETLRNLYNERIESCFFKNEDDSGYALYQYCADHICTFHL